MHCDLASEENTEADAHALDRLILGFEEEYGVEETQPELWHSYFRSHAKFITLCNHCLDKLEQARLKKLIKTPGRQRATRPQDISDDDEEEEPIFDPMVVARSSAEGRMMSKWLGAARTRLGGAGGAICGGRGG